MTPDDDWIILTLEDKTRKYVRRSAISSFGIASSGLCYIVLSGHMLPVQQTELELIALLIGVNP